VLITDLDNTLGLVHFGSPAANGADVSEVMCVGDSLMKDIVMAQGAGVTDVWAKYGESHRRDGYDLLRRVSHWTPQDVERERRRRRYRESGGARGAVVDLGGRARETAEVRR
jgi:hypothetical protein